MRQRPLRVVAAGEDLDRDVAQLGVVLEEVEQRPAFHVGQPQVEGDGLRLELAGHREARLAA